MKCYITLLNSFIEPWYYLWLTLPTQNLIPFPTNTLAWCSKMRIKQSRLRNPGTILQRLMNSRSCFRIARPFLRLWKKCLNWGTTVTAAAHLDGQWGTWNFSRRTGNRRSYNSLYNQKLNIKNRKYRVRKYTTIPRTSKKEIRDMKITLSWWIK